MRADLEHRLQDLVGLPLWGISRTADLLILKFGARQSATAEDGSTGEIGSVVLQVACPWRLREAERILVGSGDLLTPSDPEADLETFDWDEPGANWLDVRLTELAALKVPSPPFVKGTSVDELGGFQLVLSEGRVFEAFPTSTATGHVATEFWRLLRPGTVEPAFVVGTFGIEEEVGG